jgi:hypothetical protein
MGDRFAAARIKFLDSLPDGERASFSTCSSRRELLSEIESLKTAGYQRNKSITKVFSKIDGFSKSLECYFKVIEIVISSNPEYSAIVWGTLRLFLQVRSRDMFRWYILLMPNVVCKKLHYVLRETSHVTWFPEQCSLYTIRRGHRCFKVRAGSRKDGRNFRTSTHNRRSFQWIPRNRRRAREPLWYCGRCSRWHLYRYVGVVPPNLETICKY